MRADAQGYIFLIF